MKKALLTAILVFIVAVILCPSLTMGQGSFKSWESINMTGVSKSFIVIEMGGVTDSHLIIATNYTAVFPPTNLVLTAISDYEVLVEWDKGLNAENTMVRAALGRIPTDRSDGYLVYYGTDEEATDYAVDLNDGRMYYRAWSQDDVGTWEDEGIWAYIGGTMILMILFGIMGLGLTGMFFWKRSSFLAYGAAGAWALLGFQSFMDSGSTNPTNIADTYMALFWLCIGFVIGCALLPLIMRERPTKEDIYVDRDIDGSDLSGVLPEKKETEERKLRPSTFAKTGEM